MPGLGGALLAGELFSTRVDIGAVRGGECGLKSNDNRRSGSICVCVWLDRQFRSALDQNGGQGGKGEKQDRRRLHPLEDWISLHCMV